MAEHSLAARMHALDLDQLQQRDVTLWFRLEVVPENREKRRGSGHGLWLGGAKGGRAGRRGWSPASWLLRGAGVARRWCDNSCSAGE